VGSASKHNVSTVHLRGIKKARIAFDHVETTGADCDGPDGTRVIANMEIRDFDAHAFGRVQRKRCGAGRYPGRGRQSYGRRTSSCGRQRDSIALRHTWACR
jgi:hypothetical protein